MKEIDMLKVNVCMEILRALDRPSGSNVLEALREKAAKVLADYLDQK